MTKPWEINGFLDIRNGQLHIDAVSAVELAHEYGTPLFVFSESRIRHNIDRLKKVADVIERPLKLCYAAKAMSTMAILRAVKDAGADIEVNSGGELWKALKIGFAGDQIIFNGTSKEVWELEMAIDAGIYALQVDSPYELSLIEETATRLGKRANVSLRLVPEIESGTHSGLQTALLTSKFGMMPDEADAAFLKYRDSPHLDLCGIHLHVGSQNPDPEVYTQALQVLFGNLIRIFEQTGVRLKHINLGGGFPVNYSRGKRGLPEEMQKKVDDLVSKGVERIEINGGVSFVPVPKQLIEWRAREKMFEADYDPAETLAVAWTAARDKIFPDGDTALLDGVAVLLEPGRSVIADAGICLTSVRNVKDRPLTKINEELSTSTDKAEAEREKQFKQQGGSVSFGVRHINRSFVDKSITSERWLLTDAGFNILLSMETYKWYYHLISAVRAGEEHDFPYKLAGPLCDGGDVYFDIEDKRRLPEYRLLPENAQPGEVLALLNCGAYSLAQASQYNGRALPPVVLIDSEGRPRLIRRRDSFEDLINNDIY